MVRMLWSVSGTCPDTAATACRYASCAVSHPLLHHAGKDGKEREDQEEKQRKSRIFHRDHDENGEDPARIRHHADDPGREQSLHGIDIPGKAGSGRTGILCGQGRGGQAVELLRHFRPERVGHLLSEYNKERLLSRRQAALQCEGAEIQQYRGKGDRNPSRQIVHDAGKEERPAKAMPQQTLPHRKSYRTRGAERSVPPNRWIQIHGGVSFHSASGFCA